MAAQYLVKRGIRWNVGNGDSIRVWGDKWLPSPSTFRITSLRLFLQTETRVSELISHDVAAWKTQIIDAIFLPHEAELIKSIPLSSCLPEDTIVWAATPNGLFTVRSAYRLAMEESRSSNRASSSDPSKTRRFWKSLWRLQVPHKMRHFAWRACRGILPTKENLSRRGIQLDVSCEECKENIESVGHLLWSCSRAKEVWQCTKLKLRFDQTQVISFHDLLWQILMSGSHEEKDAELVVTVAWAMWFNCNEVRHGGRKKSAEALFQWARQYLQKFQEANQLAPSTVMPRVVGWSPPPSARYKVNVDGAVFSAQKCAGVGVMIKDSNGHVIAALSRKLSAPLGALEVEAKAFEVGLEFARDVGVHDFVLEDDSLVVYNALYGSSTPPFMIAPIIWGILMSCGPLNRIDFSHVKMHDNRSVHLLAKYV